MIKRYRLVLFLAATTVFVVVALSVAVWPLIAGTLPAGVRPASPVATLTVRNTDGRSGIRVSALEAIKDVAGVRSVYYAHGTAFLLAHGERELEVLGSFVNDAYFPSLGVAIQGPGFRKFSPWQRNLRKECVIGQSLEHDLSGGSGKSMLGEDLDVNGRSCTIVGVVEETFSGMRPPTAIRLWITGPPRLAWGA
ncbi:MAG: ABC transporter permease [Ahniella sp.]|nr:ABC transporter permease [Ahniella sp.]